MIPYRADTPPGFPLSAPGPSTNCGIFPDPRFLKCGAGCPRLPLGTSAVAVTPLLPRQVPHPPFPGPPPPPTCLAVGAEPPSVSDRLSHTARALPASASQAIWQCNPRPGRRKFPCASAGQSRFQVPVLQYPPSCKAIYNIAHDLHTYTESIAAIVCNKALRVAEMTCFSGGNAVFLCYFRCT